MSDAMSFVKLDSDETSVILEEESTGFLVVKESAPSVVEEVSESGLLRISERSTTQEIVEQPAPTILIRGAKQTTVEGVNGDEELLLIDTRGRPGPAGPAGAPGADGSDGGDPDIPDLVILFENGLV